MSNVNTQHKNYSSMVTKWKRCRDTVAGQDAVHDAGDTYLPRLADQSDSDYKSYVARASFFNSVWRTISSLSGMIFRKAPVVESSTAVEELLKDVTMAGVSFDILLQTSTIEILTSGRMGVLVDYPSESTGGKTVAEVEKMGLRPCMQTYPAETIINWKTTRINNQTKLSMVVLTEEFSEPDGEFGEKTETHYRVLDLTSQGEGFFYRVREYKIVDKADVLISETIPLMNGVPLDFIPFYFIGVDDTTPAIDEPPLIDLVDASLSHYRLNADYNHGLHFTGLPTPVVSGYTPENSGDKLYIGSSSAWVFPDPQAKASYLEYTGQGLQAIKSALEELKQEMAILGARLLSSEKKDTETAQTAQIHRAGESSVLSAIARTISIGFTSALNTFSQWAGAQGNWSVSLNRDFLPIEMTPQELAVILQAWQAGLPGYSDESVFATLQKREVVSLDVTLEEEQERIANRRIPEPGLTEE